MPLLTRRRIATTLLGLAMATSATAALAQKKYDTGANDAEIFGKVIVPLTIPHILTAVRVALGVAWATLVASELIAAQQGLGALIQNASSFFQLDIIYVGIICIGFIALAMDLLLRAATRRLVAWQDRLA